MPKEIMDDVKVVATALNELRAKVFGVAKTGSNPHFHYDYVEESHLIASVREKMIEVGLVLTPEVPGEIQVFTETGKNRDLVTVVFTQVYHLAHVSGAVWPWPISVAAAGQDTGDKHVWKASTGASKYAIMRLLQLATGDDPEQDKGTAAPAQSKPSGSSRPAPRPRSRKPSSSVAELLANEDPEALAGRDLLRSCGVWGAVFQAAERIHGKGEEHKFKVVDAFCESHEMRSSNQLRVKHIEPLLKFAAQYQGEPPEMDAPVGDEDEGPYDDLP